MAPILLLTIHRLFCSRLCRPRLRVLQYQFLITCRCVGAEFIFPTSGLVFPLFSAVYAFRESSSRVYRCVNATPTLLYTIDQLIVVRIITLSGS